MGEQQSWMRVFGFQEVGGISRNAGALGGESVGKRLWGKGVVGEMVGEVEVVGRRGCDRPVGGLGWRKWLLCRREWDGWPCRKWWEGNVAGGGFVGQRRAPSVEEEKRLRGRGRFVSWRVIVWKGSCSRNGDGGACERAPPSASVLFGEGGAR